MVDGQGALTNQINNILFAMFAWAMWTFDHKMTIEKYFSRAPTNVIYIALSLM